MNMIKDSVQHVELLTRFLFILFIPDYTQGGNIP